MIRIMEVIWRGNESVTHIASENRGPHISSRTLLFFFYYYHNGDIYYNVVKLTKRNNNAAAAADP